MSEASKSVVLASKKTTPSYMVPVLGATMAGCFYLLVAFVPWSPLQRYFLGHPVAVAATVLFCFAVAILAVKWLAVSTQWKTINGIADERLFPRNENLSPSDDYRNRHDAGHVARGWLKSLSGLTLNMQRSWLVIRLQELLTRQSQRGTTKHLSDDLRELSSRDADDAHDSLALVRIIVWAIPMLGFLGTVIGITQTLGGLDFSNGNAAVDNLKSGLYVAFDTTALGLVLSVLAIFLQFPVEKSEQRLLAEIDHRVGHLLSAGLPSDEPADNQYELLANLCEGVRAAVAESLANQADLWRGTIDEAQQYWQRAHETQANGIIDAIESTLKPALIDHAYQLESSSQRNHERTEKLWDRWQQGIGQWQDAMDGGAQVLASHHETLIAQCDRMLETSTDTGLLMQLQAALDSNLERLQVAGQQIDKNLGAAAGQGMADAMRILARAVDVLSKQLPASAAKTAAAKTAATSDIVSAVLPSTAVAATRTIKPGNEADHATRSREAA
ncbi:MotA/TolQ/ExbB proton channel family protein [Stieleria varia]|uniref:MotA/TolQ/ExbB proton channel family protein n=1 Tax=Stieleria varia TaxID=2528005 RepID=A0A5C6AF58_9BACT|nr:MotA/TolQ/ExbB proton channel family protein [Stieleria varia]TWT98604.1 MotA/TolQ/ExbB proton channel family protein [Stieleria varia]